MVSDPRRSYHHGDLARALLAEAERSLAAGEELNLRGLARAVGVSPAAPFRHFADRRALLDALARTGFEQLSAALDAAVAQAPPAFPDRLVAVARAYARFAVHRPALLETMVAARRRDPALARLADDTLATSVAVIERAQADGEAVAGEHVTSTVCATLDGIALRARTGGLPGEVDALDDAVTQAVGHLLAGIRTRAPRGTDRSLGGATSVASDGGPTRP